MDAIYGPIPTVACVNCVLGLFYVSRVGGWSYEYNTTLHVEASAGEGGRNHMMATIN